MNYLYYPGCSLKSTGRAYEESVRAVFARLDAPLAELEDWNCCGATAYMAISEMKAFALSARNLVLAERQAGPGREAHLVVPCAACYLVLMKTQHYLEEDGEAAEKIKSALEAAGLTYEGRVRVRHPLDVLVHDIGCEKVRERVSHPLEGVKVASYYGCQIVRPYAEFDDQNDPTSMDRLMTAAGARAVDWPLKTRCCGGSLTGTIPEVGLRLSQVLLLEARKRGADVVATACPLCQFNLECYQGKMNRTFDRRVGIPSAFFTQILGAALGVSPRELGLTRLFTPVEPILAAAGKGAER